MSTLRRTSRLLIVLGLGFGATGCATAPGPRAGAMSKMKTFLSVGDKPLPVVTGEPGSTLAADTGRSPDSDSSSARRRARPDGRISGRVYDTDGRPVPEARVRLAVDGAPGGKIVSATTDRSGAFTLHGLRPGSDYTVIAEWEGDDGVMSGRTDARTSDTDVRISLGGQDDASPRAAGPSPVNRVSDREPSEESPPEPGAVTPAEGDGPDRRTRPAPAVNEEDVPPAVEAEAMTDDGFPPTRNRSPDSPRRPMTASNSPDAWRRGSTRPGSAGPTDPESEANPLPPARTAPTSRPGRDAAPIDSEARGTGAPVGNLAPPDDDGENPLPPALEPIPENSTSAGPDAAGPVPAASPFDPDPFEEKGPRVVGRSTGPGPVRPGKTSTPVRRSAASSPFESPTSPTEPVTTSPPDDAAPGALVVVPETFGPLVVKNPDPFNGVHPAPAPAPAPTASEPEPAPPPASRPKRRPVRSAGENANSKPVEAAAAPTRTAAGDRRRPTWGEISASAGPTATAALRTVTESAGRTVAEAGPGAGVARRGPVAKAEDAATRAVKTAYGKPVCEYDDRLRRIIDFRLPDLEGKPVRFRDIDADLVLIDFWGTWCQPCLQSIPHLVELQERMGKRLAVVGVACEADLPEASSAKVTETVRRLKVNYPVLLSRNDGSCPLQEALHVSAFPTMILVDREGRVLWRDQGATPATLARLDRVIAAAPEGDDTRKY